MELVVFLAVIGSAAFQAGWNFYTKSFKGDRILLLVAGWGMTGVFLIPAAVLFSGTEAVSTKGILFATASGVIHTVYVVLLGRAYGKGDLSIIFPVSRGGGVALTCTLALLLGIERISLAGMLGIALVICGIAAVCAARIKGTTSIRSEVTAALTVSLAIGSYSLVDKIGTTHAPLLLYLGIMNLMPAVLLMPWYCTSRKAEMLDIIRSHKIRAVLVAGAGSVAYLIILWAFRKSSASYVVALREISIVFAMLLGVFVLKESLTRAKIAAIAAILTGIVLIKIA